MARRLAGHEHVGFHNPTFLSERATADRNYALGWFMKEKKVKYPGSISKTVTSPT